MKRMMILSTMLAALLLGFGAPAVVASPASSTLPAITLLDGSQSQSMIEEVRHRCHWHRRCGWRHGYWTCWRVCHRHRHHRGFRLYYY